MTLRFAYTRPDGGLCIVNAAPIEQLARVLGPLTQEEYRVHVFSRSIPPDATNIRELPDGWEPTEDRTFRDVWVLDGKAVSIDMPKAREIAHTIRRAKRETELSPLDKQINIDIATPAKIAVIEAKRQGIRDKYAIMQTNIDEATSEEELKIILG